MFPKFTCSSRGILSYSKYNSFAPLAAQTNSLNSSELKLILLTRRLFVTLVETALRGSKYLDALSSPFLSLLKAKKLSDDMELDRNDLTSSQSAGTELRMISLSLGILSLDRILRRDIHFSSERLNFMSDFESRVTVLPMYFW